MKLFLFLFGCKRCIYSFLNFFSSQIKTLKIKNLKDNDRVEGRGYL